MKNSLFKRQLSQLCISKLLLAALLLFGFMPNSLFAAPVTNAAIESAQAQADKAKQELGSLGIKLELASEDYEEAKEQLAQTQEEIKKTNQKLKETEIELKEAQKQFETRAAGIYKDGNTSVFSLLIGATSFQELISRIELATKISEQDSELMAKIRTIKSIIENTKHNLEVQEKEEARLTELADKKLKEAKSLYKQQNDLLNSLNAEVKRLMDEERKRQEEAARRAAEAARRAAEEAARQQAQKPGTPSPTPPQLGAPNSAVVAFARQFVGVVWYQWGGTTPAGFDCSGLTMYSYRHAVGKNIPRTSRQQFKHGTFIPPDRKDLLQPGDLLFFGYNADPTRVHHVAIYSGNGMMIHAPQTGYKVEEVSLSRRRDYVGATRP